MRHCYEDEEGGASALIGQFQRCDVSIRKRDAAARKPNHFLWLVRGRVLRMCTFRL